MVIEGGREGLTLIANGGRPVALEFGDQSEIESA